ncbi:MAG: heavy metal-binding domain-containing protein [Beijerinckiaceae bacterium]
MARHRKSLWWRKDNPILGEHINAAGNTARVYACPMHSGIRQANAGKCPKCRMDLLSDGTRSSLLRHMISSPSTAPARST